MEIADLLNDIFDAVDSKLHGSIYYPSEAFKRGDKLVVRVYTDPVRRGEDIKWKQKDILLDDDDFFYD